jgi:glutamine amidotransferase
MQMLLDVSEEFGRHRGLGVIPGSVVLIPTQGIDGRPHKIPHIGWNALIRADGSAAEWDTSILRDVAMGGDSVYFVHSFHALPENPQDRLADCYYDGVRITAAVCCGTVYGCQFHPEKSGKTGLKILSNFLNLT